MLRRKLLLNLFPLVVLLLLTAVIAIWLLQDVLRHLRHIDEEAWVVVEQVNELSIAVNAMELDLYELQLGRSRRLDSLITDVEAVAALVEQIGQSPIVHRTGPQIHFARIEARLPVFKHRISALATADDSVVAHQHIEAALSSALAMRQDTLPLSRYVRDHAHAEQEALATWFRWLVLGLAIVFLVVINVSVVVLMRMSGMILRPVELLLAGSRSLAAERLDTRICVPGDDEFGQLAQAFNSMAAQLEANEQRKVEVLGQVALTLNHELNNAIGIIELQLQLLTRRAGGDPAQVKILRQIHDGLQRMAATVRSLGQIRRIVLTDYVPGMKMLDLERSVADEPETNPAVLAGEKR